LSAPGYFLSAPGYITIAPGYITIAAGYMTIAPGDFCIAAVLPAGSNVLQEYLPAARKKNGATQVTPPYRKDPSSESKNLRREGARSCRSCLLQKSIGFLIKDRTTDCRPGLFE